MKDELLYLVFVIFTFMLLSSEQKGVRQLHQEVSSIEVSIEDINDVTTVPEFNFSLQKVEVFRFVAFVFDKNMEATKSFVNNQLVASYFKQYQPTTIDIQHFHQKTHLLKIVTANNKKDNSLLS